MNAKQIWDDLQIRLQDYTLTIELLRQWVCEAYQEVINRLARLVPEEIAQRTSTTCSGGEENPIILPDIVDRVLYVWGLTTPFYQRPYIPFKRGNIGEWQSIQKNSYYQATIKSPIFVEYGRRMWLFPRPDLFWYVVYWYIPMAPSYLDEQQVPVIPRKYHKLIVFSAEIIGKEALGKPVGELRAFYESLYEPLKKTP